MSPTHSNQLAEHLKAQGNELHQKGQYKAAYNKYSEAIKEDPRNAIYYANRAASSLAMKQYMDAAVDAKKATKINPKYGKAWARLGTANQALSIYSESRDAWRKALKCLPSEDRLLSESDKQLKTQYTEGLRKAEQKLRNPTTINHFQAPSGDMPWTKAEAMEKELLQAQRLSSGFVILKAYRVGGCNRAKEITQLLFKEFKEGVDSMKMLEWRQGPPQPHWWGKTGALVDISNGIMTDPRVFHIDSDNWVEQYNKQVIFESEAYKAWKEGGVNIVGDLALQRLKREGWDSVRPALATTVRAWIMCGFLAITVAKRELLSMEYYSRVIDILEWGRRTWANIPRIERGAIFELSFIRGAKRLRLNALHEILASKVKDCHYTRENLVEWCRDLIAETDANPPTHGTEIDPGTILAFWVYPKGDALAILGWHHMQLGLAAEDAEDSDAEFTESARYYIEAAHTFPEDDEKRPYYLKVAIEAYWFQSKPLDDVFLLTAGISHCFPKVFGLWEHSATMKEMGQYVMQAFEFSFACREAIDKGEISMKDIVKPKSLKSTDRWATPAVKYV